MKPINYGRHSITEADRQSVLDVLDGDFLTQGPKVLEFENSVKDYVNAKYAVAVTNGTAALHLAAMALGVKPGDRVLVASNSFVASANCIRYCGADVEFVDIDPNTFCMDLTLLKEKLSTSKSNNYAGIVCVDFAGYPMNFQELRKIADEYGLWIIEDACHAIGAEFLTEDQQWVKAGNGQFADVSVFSFHPVKHIATGEGGMLMTARKDIFEKVSLLRTHGITKDTELLINNDGPWYYEMQDLGFNYRISDILCALGTSQMKRIFENISRRREIADIYNQELAGLNLVTPALEPGRKHAYHLYVIQTENRLGLYSHLKERNINCQIHYIPMYKTPYYKKLYGNIELKNNDLYYSRTLSLPMYHGLSESDQSYVIESIKSF